MGRIMDILFTPVQWRDVIYNGPPLKDCKLLLIRILPTAFLIIPCLAFARPNVIFIYTDDQKRGTIHALGNEIINTPNLDRMVAEGTYFENSIIAGANSGAVCVPSRAMVLTGKSLYRCGGGTIQGVTMPQNMMNNGYESWHFGKWHNDKASHVRSFTGGHAIAGVAGCTALNINWEYNVCPFDPTGAYDGSEAFKEEGVHTTTTIINPAIDSALRYSGDKPFFMYIAPHAPHDPRTAPQEYHDKYPPEDIPVPPNFMEEHPFPIGEYKTVRDEKLLGWPRTIEDYQKENSDYYAIIDHLDYEIGRLFQALDSTGLMDSTIIVFAGDHGLGMGEHALYGKQNVYEHTAGEPLLFMGPGIPRGKRSDALVYLLDIYPTIMDLAGVTIPDGVDGKSLVPVFEGLENNEDVDVRNSQLYSYKNYARAVRDERYKLIENFPNGAGTEGSRHTQLFDLWLDPWETTNLAEDNLYADVLLRLRQEMGRWKTEWNDNSSIMNDWVLQYPVPDETIVVEYEGKGCMDSLYEEYDADAVYETTGSCRTLAISRFPQGPEFVNEALWGGGTRKVTVLDIGGRIVREYDVEFEERIWDSRDHRGNRVAPGVYVVMTAGIGKYTEVVLKE